MHPSPLSHTNASCPPKNCHALRSLTKHTKFTQHTNTYFLRIRITALFFTHLTNFTFLSTLFSPMNDYSGIFGVRFWVFGVAEIVGTAHFLSLAHKKKNAGHS